MNCIVSPGSNLPQPPRSLITRASHRRQCRHQTNVALHDPTPENGQGFPRGAGDVDLCHWHATGSTLNWSRASRRFRIWITLALLILLAGPPALISGFLFLAPPATPLMLIRLAQGHAIHQQWVPYEKISSTLAEAVIASEDNLFCEESLGFDFKATRAQIDAWWDGDRPRGASTITMQTAKNLLLWPGRDPVRKFVEAWLTPQIALIWPKRRILEMYLNIVEFGPGIYGAEAAARTFFGKHASALSPREASQLATVLPRPLVWSAAAPSAYLRQRAEVIEERVGQIRPLFACAR
jgi:monofunctional biosynthetic peptidoglycan transglycosylase